MESEMCTDNAGRMPGIWSLVLEARLAHWTIGCVNRTPEIGHLSSNGIAHSRCLRRPEQRPRSLAKTASVHLDMARELIKVGPFLMGLGGGRRMLVMVCFAAAPDPL